MKYPQVSIFVLNYNGKKDTEACLDSLLKTKYPNFQVTILDNGSQKNEARLLEKKYQDKRFTFIRSNKNLGFTGGNNFLLKKITTPYVVLLNNDTIVQPSWLNPLVQLMERRPNVAIVQPKILWERDRQYFDYAGACGGYIDNFGYQFTSGRIFNALEEDQGQYDTVADIFWASGAAMIIRTEVLKKVGLFDETFFNYMEEIDLCCRILQAGYQVVCEPKGVVYHKVAATASANSQLKRYYEHRNNLYFISKHFPRSKLLYVLPIRLLMDYASALYYIYLKKPSYVLSVIKSHIDFFRLVNKNLFRANTQNEYGKVRHLMYPGSIVIAYFLLKNRTFASIFQIKRRLKHVSL